MFIIFSAGPAVLPVPVLEKVQRELLSYNGSGMSVMELSHRSELFQNILDDAESLIRELMEIPDNYKVLFFARWREFAIRYGADESCKW